MRGEVAFPQLPAMTAIALSRISSGAAFARQPSVVRLAQKAAPKPALVLELNAAQPS